MTLITELLPKDYGFVLVAAASTFILSTWHGIRVGTYRKKAGIKYPQPYGDSFDIKEASAEKKEAIYLFNCAQRAHGNYLENQTAAVIPMLIAGLQYPRTAAIMGAGWMAGRIVFALGYTNPKKENGKGRLSGSFFWLFQLGLVGLTGWTGVQMLL